MVENDLLVLNKKRVFFFFFVVFYKLQTLLFSNVKIDMSNAAELVMNTFVGVWRYVNSVLMMISSYSPHNLHFGMSISGSSLSDR